ncbi:MULTISPECIES: WecB/TagA/CpsF family glycosyltransferase [Thalassospira]|uniref:WecB/TagA/CpsF family glycosyltransferase n=1 Tax=Thalassospira aquimaris TaxID=3037796 RepID=A0ABT6G7Y1_9PROT|nr:MULTISPECIES: WecB/TagA/CpsF family glycosyltransferase [Thalassospira]MDG4718167.1 WecB/TagA/CpsF family glycosyltransferase [Thalassospira sp. FZY0004]
MRQGMVSIFGLLLDLRQREKLCADICDWLVVRARSGTGSCFRQQSLNALKLTRARSDARLRDALLNVHSLNADGMGIVWVARLLGVHVPERVSGIDVMIDLLPRFEKQRVGIFLLGARADVLDDLERKLRTLYPGLLIAGTHHGYEPDDAKLARIVRQSGADALFVALPSPRKEIFIDQYGDYTGCGFAMGVGGAFDVLAGRIPRAPVTWQNAGLEFLWRILMQPRAMLPRYGRGLAAFCQITLPAIIGYQFQKLNRWCRLVLVGVALVPFLMVVADAQVPTTSPEMVQLDDAEMVRNWIESRLDGISDPQDVQEMIDQLLGLVLFGNPENQPNDAQATMIDWQAVDATLSALLNVMEVILVASGGNNFLLETVLGGVFKQLLGIHPNPARLSNLIRSDLPDFSSRFFQDDRPSESPVTVADLVPVTGNVLQPVARQPDIRTQVPLSFGTQYGLLDRSGPDPSIWDHLKDELATETEHQGDVSPR